MKSRNQQFDKFDRAMHELIKVPHSDIKAKLDAERSAKAKKREAKKSSASRDSSDREDA